MGRRKNLATTPQWRERIQVGMLLKLLEDNVAGKIKLNAGRIRSAEILLRKAMPDLASMEHKGELTENVRYVAEMPLKDITTEAWLMSNSKPTPQNPTKPVENAQQALEKPKVSGYLTRKQANVNGPNGTQ